MNKHELFFFVVHEFEHVFHLLSTFHLLISNLPLRIGDGNGRIDNTFASIFPPCIKKRKAKWIRRFYVVRGWQYRILTYSFFSVSKQQHMDLYLTLPCCFLFPPLIFFPFAVNITTSSSNFHFHRNFHCEKIKILYNRM